jgi:predicted metal-dependent peptidase
MLINHFLIVSAHTYIHQILRLLKINDYALQVNERYLTLRMCYRVDMYKVQIFFCILSLMSSFQLDVNATMNTCTSNIQTRMIMKIIHCTFCHVSNMCNDKKKERLWELVVFLSIDVYIYTNFKCFVFCSICWLEMCGTSLGPNSCVNHPH